MWRGAAALLARGALLALALPGLQPGSGARSPTQQAKPASSTPAPSLAPPLPATDSRVVSEAKLAREVERWLPSLPLAYWTSHKDDENKFYKRKDCAPLPSIYELEYNNKYWQTLRTSNGTFHLYGAYLDARPTAPLGPAVRLLAVHDRVRPTQATHCQLWFEGRAAPVVVRNLEYKYLWEKDLDDDLKIGVMQPFLLACVLPPDVRQLAPAAVSLVAAPCDRASNCLKVQYDPVSEGERRKDFAVCVKGLDFLHTDLSVRLVEWIELLRLLGAKKIFFYELHVHSNITKVLRHYEALGVVSVTPTTLSGSQPNLPGLQHAYLKHKLTHKRKMEVILYNDCLYRHMYRYRWLALLDIDEVIVPLQDADWPGLLRRVAPLATPAAGKPPSSYHASNLLFLDSLQRPHAWAEAVPRYMHMLQHVYRTGKFSEPLNFVKAFHETDLVLALHDHFPLACLGGACSSYQLPEEVARLQHYRTDCWNLLGKACGELRAAPPVRDMALWRWRDQLVARVSTALRALGFLPPLSPPK